MDCKITVSSPDILGFFFFPFYFFSSKTVVFFQSLLLSHMLSSHWLPLGHMAAVGRESGKFDILGITDALSKISVLLARKKVRI